MVDVVVVERLRPNMGRNQNKTYVNVVIDARRFAIGQTLAQWVAANPTHPWNDPTANDFIIEITPAEFDDFESGTNLIFHDGNVLNEPRWQQQNADTGSVKSLGSFADPESAVSAFTADVPLPDDRWIVRIYTEAAATNHVATEEFDESLTPGASVERFIKLFNSNDTPSGTNAANQRTTVGSKLMDFDFGSSDGLSPGVARFNVRTDKAGQGDFASNHQYRVLGPTGEKEYIWRVFGKTIDVNPE